MSRIWMGFLLLGIIGTAWAIEPTRLRAADSYPVGYPTTAGLLEMGRYLEEKSGGQIRLVLYPDGELGSERETIEMVQIGALDIARVSAAELAEFSPAMEVFSLPYLFRNEYHLWAVLESPLGERLLSELAAQQIIGLCFYEAGARGFYTTQRPVYRPEDLRGLKIRVPYSRVMEEIVRSLQAIPTMMRLSEVYSALQLGVIDGAEESLLAYFWRRHYERARYYTFSEHGRIPDVVIMSAKAWNQLSAQDQLLIKRAAAHSARMERKWWQALEAQARNQLREQGVQVIELKKEMRALFVRALEPVRRKYRKRDLELVIQAIPDTGMQP